ncbi:MBL fold metallo-hydrolase [Macrococcus hajekii]|uniref:MBL fold metallo-hydrolase n=1 Tax=Macrococcus hajekii TaxID=198482 RepID=A0A4R6BJV9_9STAP|nr:MBL fold metallo-hydrolase [Macrococcus hajekii]TDM01995.1 MBL fold metallo-hydrolase [Macrococcus hajekii]GGB09157.1 Zn-dependent hydrolase [Macrococcus hajekii]
MFFKSFFNEQLAQMSYLVGCQKTGEAIVIDPLRDLTPYFKTAEQEGLKITQVTETHIHADFASGLREMVNAGAKGFVSGHGGKDWSYKEVEAETVMDGDIIKVGNVKLQVMHTPGHTPESISFLLYDNGSEVPMGIFTGDFIFVGDVGRPDLLEEAAGIKDTTEIGAREMFNSLRKVDELPDYIQIWPGHGAGSACGKSLGAVPVTTLGYERQNSWAFQYDDERAFIKALTADQPEPPTYFSEMKRINRDGFELMHNDLVVPAEQIEGHTIDLRDKEVFAENMSRGINIPYNKKFLSFTGWYLDYSQDLQLIGDFETVQQAAHDLKMIGFDKVKTYIPDAAGPAYPQIEPTDFKELDYSAINILDVRTQKEWNESHIEEAEHLHFGKLMQEEIPFNQEEKIYVHCQSGVRSAIAMSVLNQKGFNNIVNIKRGYEAIK